MWLDVAVIQSERREADLLRAMLKRCGEVSLFVDPLDGDDDNDCSPTHPCRTLTSAFHRLPRDLSTRVTTNIGCGLAQ